jgi:hypothetical protein
MESEQLFKNVRVVDEQRSLGGVWLRVRIRWSKKRDLGNDISLKLFQPTNFPLVEWPSELLEEVRTTTPQKI